MVINIRKILFVLLIGMLALTSGCIETGKGQSKDTIYGIEQDGLIWKTYSMWLTNDHPSFSKDKSYTAIYSIDKNDVELINKLKDAADNKKTVIVYYRNEAFVMPWEYSSGTIVYDMKVVE